MIARETLKRTVAGLLLAASGMLATGCDEAFESMAKAGTAGKIVLPAPLGLEVPPAYCSGAWPSITDLPGPHEILDEGPLTTAKNLQENETNRD